MGNSFSSFDKRPTLVIVVSSLALTAGLIAMSSVRSQDAVETAALRVQDLGVERVVARQIGSQSLSRQIISPSVTPLTSDAAQVAQTVTGGDDEQLGESPEDIETEVAGASLDSDDGAPPERTEQGETTANQLALVELPATTVAPVTVESPTAGTIPTAPTLAPRRATTTTVTSTAAPRVPADEPRAATVAAPERTSTTTTTTTTTTTSTTTTTVAPRVINPAADGRYTVAQVINGTISAGDGSNPNEEAPMGRHDAPVYLPQAWNWAQGPTRNGVWGNLSSNQFTEWRCAVIPEFGHRPSVPFRINVRNGAYWQYANNAWNKAFDVVLDSNNHGAYLGRAGQLNTDPFSSGGPGTINWRQEADGSFSAPWHPDALMMHFWAGERRSPASGQTAEFLTSELRLQQPDGQQVDLGQVRVLFQCGIDYYNTRGGQGTQVPGPGIGTYQLATSSWKPGLWVTLPGNVAANSSADFRTWLTGNLPPDVRP